MHSHMKMLKKEKGYKGYKTMSQKSNKQKGIYAFKWTNM